MSDEKAKVFLAKHDQRSRVPKIIAMLAVLILLGGAGWFVYERPETHTPSEAARPAVDERVEMEKQLRAGNVDYIEAYLKDAASKARPESPCIYRCAMVERNLTVFAQYDGILDRNPATRAIGDTAKALGELLSAGTPIARAEIEFKNIKGTARVVVPMEQTRQFGEERKRLGQPANETFAAYTKAIDWSSFDALFGPGTRAKPFTNLGATEKR